MEKFILRFFFCFFFLITAVWSWLYLIPGANYLLDFYDKGNLWLVSQFNEYLLHVKDVLNANGYGSGDTSFDWAQFYTYIIIAFVIAAIWTVIDWKKNKSDAFLGFFLRNLVRYYVALFSFSYGIIKIFALQMPFPNLSQLATPLGDYLPMRLSWMFIGYSTTYQVFCGVTEIIVGILLFYRRTVTLGALVGIGVFANVFVLNLSYDIPVKLFSMLLLICCLFLVAFDWQRLFSFFMQNKSTEPSSLYDHLFLKRKWVKVSRWILKIGFVIVFVIRPSISAMEWYNEFNIVKAGVIPVGVYDIKRSAVNGDTVSVYPNDQIAWKDFIFDKNQKGSVHTADTLFTQRYRRGYFTYQPDTVRKVIVFRKSANDTTSLFEMQYHMIDSTHLNLWGMVKDDSLYFELVKSDHHFQLTERQFHWISEGVR